MNDSQDSTQKDAQTAAAVACATVIVGFAVYWIVQIQDVREMLALPPHIGDAQRRAFEDAFQSMDSDDDRAVTIEEFSVYVRAHHVEAAAATPEPETESQANPMALADGTSAGAPQQPRTDSCCAGRPAGDQFVLARGAELDDPAADHTDHGPQPPPLLADVTRASPAVAATLAPTWMGDTGFQNEHLAAWRKAGQQLDLKNAPPKPPKLKVKSNALPGPLEFFRPTKTLKDSS